MHREMGIRTLIADMASDSEASLFSKNPWQRYIPIQIGDFMATVKPDQGEATCEEITVIPCAGAFAAIVCANPLYPQNAAATISCDLCVFSGVLAVLARCRDGEQDMELGGHRSANGTFHTRRQHKELKLSSTQAFS